MKRGLRASSPSRALIALAAALVLLLAGCSPTGDSSERLKPTSQPVYPQVRTYPNIRVTENVDYGGKAGSPSVLDVCLPKATADNKTLPAVLSIHGGSWRQGDKDNINWRSVCQWLASEGFVTFSVDYRLAPQHPFPAGFDDVRTAVRWMRSSATVNRYNIDPDRIGVFGGSAGGNLAALLGTWGSGGWTTGSRVAAVAELSGPTNLTATGREADDFVPLELQYLACSDLTDCPQARTASPLYHVDKTDPPFFIGHSLSERIPLQQSASFVRRLRGAGVDVTFVTVKGTLHSIAMLNPAMRSRIADFLRTKLAGP
ncbi:MAG TPA: alpha/beta hydrolase [Lacisediminihabitans sp.]|uniref:alpha/beta hydrolase n=1 Tax=Lacisediminihabitans sp. TaxID=2787631 RepID=UPI002EDA45BF